MARRNVSSASLVLSFSAAAVTLLTTACFDNGDFKIDFGRDCTSDADCSDYAPVFAIFVDRTCNPGYCEEGRCATRALKGEVSDSVHGDCHKTTCSQTPPATVPSSTIEVDDTDAPPSDRECMVGYCSSGVPGFEPAADGTMCTDGVCHQGRCGPPDGGVSDGGVSDGGGDAASILDGGDGG